METWNTYKWSIQNTEPELLQKALPVLDIVTDKKNRITKSTISGKYQQIDCLQKRSPKLREWTRSFLPSFKTCITDTLLKIGVSEEEIKNGSLRHFKLLIAPPGSEGQAPHRDGYNQKFYVIAFYLTNHESTHFSILPAPETPIPHLSVKEKQSMSSSYWNTFTSKPCQAGTISIFREDVVHKGPPNTSDTPRYVLFTVFGPKGERHTDTTQYFPWHWIEDLYGFGSDQHCRSLIEYAHFTPWNHESKKNQSYALYQQYLKSLGKHAHH